MFVSSPEILNFTKKLKIFEQCQKYVCVLARDFELHDKVENLHSVSQYTKYFHAAACPFANANTSSKQDFIRF